MYFPGPPPPIIGNSNAASRLNSVQREEGGELLPKHKTALVQVRNFANLICHHSGALEIQLVITLTKY